MGGSMSLLTKLVVLIVLWLPFTLGCLAAGGLSLLAVIFGWQNYGKNLLRAMDKTLAAVFSFSGYHTLSAECGVSKHPLAVLLRRALDLIQPGHCIGAALNEGLIKSQPEQ